MWCLSNSVYRVMLTKARRLGGRGRDGRRGVRSFVLNFLHLKCLETFTWKKSTGHPLLSICGLLLGNVGFKLEREVRVRYTYTTYLLTQQYHF